MATNPFGKWTAHRARIGAMSRPDADRSGLGEARQMLAAARLWDTVERVADDLTDEQRNRIAERLAVRAVRRG